MTAEEYIKKFNAILLAELNCKASTKYPDRYDVDGHVHLSFKNLIEIPIPFAFQPSIAWGVVAGDFSCHSNNLTSLYNAPIEVGSGFYCEYNNLSTLDHLPKYIDADLHCQNNPFQNLNALKDVEIKGDIYFYHYTENELDYCFTVKHSLKIKALYNTNLDVLEYHYDNHRYYLEDIKLENYIMNELEEIIKLKTLKRDLTLINNKLV